ncbi:hypothetical protein [Microcystis aeruginosa]|uniref:Uncharacterized protein n=1 Tax=Microcystis aeruginosa NIES-2521 TaxID=2303983 RepID=A0A5A5S0D2_MICAE|nr:hypothetical protein [Microcystis aeruginosa]GCA81890.1 hypothetical protein MiTs_03909 [Microcystis aeruginosa NIES-2521]
MTTPSNFTEFEHLQSTILRIHNQIVKEEFSDISGDDLDIAVPRSSLRWACLIKDNDTCDMMIQRFLLFYLTLRKAQDLQQPLYSIPLDDLHASRKFKPQITLYFKEDQNDVEDDSRPTWGEISFRLMNESSTTITQTELNTLANKIKTEFGAANGYVWRKGRKLYSYTEKEKGYQLQLLCRDDSTAKELINKVLDLQNDAPDWKFLKSNIADDENESFPYNPGNHTILGKSYKKPRRRPMIDVRFQYATATIWGINKPIALYDRSNTFFDALV